VDDPAAEENDGDGDFGSDRSRPVNAVEVVLRRFYASAEIAPIEPANERGAFPSTDWPLSGFAVPPLVVDANVLRNDVLYACRKKKRTSLVTATNAGFIRMFCASHVGDEVEEHGHEWATAGHVDPEEFQARWHTEYEPLLRCVEVSTALLTPSEDQRIAKLQIIDPDDVPSATLALLLGAFYLSEDGAALEAVYGPSVDKGQHHAWLLAIRAGSDSAQLTGTFQTTVLLPMLFAQGLYKAGRRIYSVSPLLLGILVAGLGSGAYVLWRSDSERAGRFRSGARDFIQILAEASNEFMTYLHECEANFSTMLATVPTWQEMNETHTGDQVLARHCIHALARHAAGQTSAAEMHAQLPFRITGQEAAVRRVLRAYEGFEQVGRGRWQIGRVFSPGQSSRS
jgi:predicted nucleic acid-binding protein